MVGNFVFVFFETKEALPKANATYCYGSSAASNHQGASKSSEEIKELLDIEFVFLGVPSADFIVVEVRIDDCYSSSAA